MIVGGLLAVFWFIVATGILVVGHEFGHFWVARKLGVKVLRFSVGFGSKPIFSWYGKDGVEYWISPIPLGGYVKFLDRDAPEVAAGARPFPQEPIWKRVLIIVAGPLANLLLALVFFAGMFMVGIADYRPVLGQVQAAAAKAGLQEGDEIVAVQGRDVSTWTDAILGIIEASFDRDSVALTIRRENMQIAAAIALPPKAERGDEETMLKNLGLAPLSLRPPTLVSAVAPATPAAKAGVLPGDRLVAVNGIEQSRNPEFFNLLQSEAAKQDGRVDLTVKRAGGATEVLTIQTMREQRGELSVYVLGVRFEAYEQTRRLGLGAAWVAAVEQCVSMTQSSLHIMYRMLVGDASVKNLSGPVTIARVTRDAADQGLADFLRILALISLSLCILNLLPIPMLDGGQLMFCAIEALKGGPLSDRIQIAGQMVGLFFVLSLAALALFNDVSRLVPGP